MATTRTATRKSGELAKLIAAKRVVFVDHYQGQHLKITARVDMPGWGVMAGETVYLVASRTYAGYYYLQKYDAGRNDWTCYCPARKPCAHQKYIAAIRLAEYRRQEQIADAQVIAPQVLGCEVAQDLRAHVEDSLESGEFDTNFAVQAQAIIDEERRDQEERAAGLTEQQRKSLAKARHNLKMSEIERQWGRERREKAALNARGQKVEQAPSGNWVPMAS